MKEGLVKNIVFQNDTSSVLVHITDEKGLGVFCVFWVFFLVFFKKGVQKNVDFFFVSSLKAKTDSDKDR